MNITDTIMRNNHDYRLFIIFSVFCYDIDHLLNEEISWGEMNLSNCFHSIPGEE